MFTQEEFYKWSHDNYHSTLYWRDAKYSSPLEPSHALYMKATNKYILFSKYPTFEELDKFLIDYKKMLDSWTDKDWKKLKTRIKRQNDSISKQITRWNKEGNNS